MIRNRREHEEALRRLDDTRTACAVQRTALAASGLGSDQVEPIVAPLLAIQAQIEDEIAWYERALERKLPAVRDLKEIGRLLVGLRIGRGLTQRELARRLGVSEAAVSRDERNEYHGITLERAQRILDAMEEVVVSEAGNRRGAYR